MNMEKFFISAGEFVSHELLEEKSNGISVYHCKFNYTNGHAISYSRGGQGYVRYVWEFHLNASL